MRCRPSAVAPSDSNCANERGTGTSEALGAGPEHASCSACLRGAAISIGSRGGTLARALDHHGCFTCPLFVDELLLRRDLCGGPGGLARRWRSFRTESKNLDVLGLGSSDSCRICITRHVRAAHEHANTRCIARAVKEAKTIQALQLSLCGWQLLAVPDDTVMQRLFGSGLPRVKWLRLVAVLTHIAGVSAAISEAAQFPLADCEWGDFALSYPSPLAHDIWRATSYWLCIIAVLLNVVSMQAQIAGILIRNPHTLLVIVISLVWTASLVKLWSWELERNLLLDLPRYVCHALIWPIIRMADALPPKVRSIVLRYFSMASSIPLVLIAVWLRLPRAPLAPGNARLNVIGIVFPSALEIMSVCSVLLRSL